MGMHNPAHPGTVLKELWLEPLGLTLTRAALRLGVTRKTISKIVNGHGAITPEMALRLEIVFGTSAQTWMNMQTAYDLWRLSPVRKTLRGSLKPVRDAAGSLSEYAGNVRPGTPMGKIKDKAWVAAVRESR